MGHVSLEHEESNPSASAKGRKAGTKRDETGRITEKRNKKSLSSANYLHLSKSYKKPIFQDGQISIKSRKRAKNSLNS
jgi:hypothetical protein